MKRRTPIPAIRQTCLECVGNSTKEARECAIPECSLHEYRMNCRPKGKAKLTPRQAIKEHCIFCMGGRGNKGRSTALRLARDCHIEKCAVWHLRPGQKMRGKEKTTPAQAIHSAEASETLNDTPKQSERQKAPLQGRF